MAGYRLNISAVDDHAHALGYVCMRWAILEARIHYCLVQLGAFSGEKEGECITCEADMGTRIAMLKGIAFLRKPSRKWLDEFVGTLNRIDSEMRIERNRYVHDMWLSTHVPSATVTRRTHKVAIKKPQSRKRELSTYHDKSISADEIWNFVYRIERVSTRLALFAEFDPQAFDFAETWP